MPRTVDPLRQVECLKFLRTWFRRRNRPPTREELGAHLGVTKVSAHLLLKKLEAGGFVTCQPSGVPHNLKLTKKGQTEEPTRNPHGTLPNITTRP